MFAATTRRHAILSGEWTRAAFVLTSHLHMLRCQTGGRPAAHYSAFLTYFRKRLVCNIYTCGWLVLCRRPKPGVPRTTRAADLVSRMTRNEKLSQLTVYAPPIPRLHFQGYAYWSEGLHGVKGHNVTSFPQVIAIAATQPTWPSGFACTAGG